MSNIYTVVGINPGQASEGYDGSFVDAVEAMTPAHAAHRCRKARAEATGRDTGDYEVIAVFEGDHLDRYDPNVAWNEAYMAELNKEFES